MAALHQLAKLGRRSESRCRTRRPSAARAWRTATCTLDERRTAIGLVDRHLRRSTPMSSALLLNLAPSSIALPPSPKAVRVGVAVDVHGRAPTSSTLNLTGEIVQRRALDGVLDGGRHRFEQAAHDDARRRSCCCNVLEWCTHQAADEPTQHAGALSALSTAHCKRRSGRRRRRRRRQRARQCTTTTSD